ncbi:hypothetical protein BJY52DRAFT_1296712 [Lactarius psammicola]|nr:hypothetical protein BJY52DRAFT_1296712 [Lactarius psammicola]
MVALFHAAFSTYEHLSHLKALGRPETSLPSSVYCPNCSSHCSSESLVPASTPALKEITWTNEMKTRFPASASALLCMGCGFRTIGDTDTRIGFANFVTRGSVLGQD